MIKSFTHKLSVRIAAGTVGVAMVVSGLSFALPAAAAGLTASQISSILSLLQSFGADQATINNVNAALNGQATTGTTGGSTGGSCSATFTRDLTIGSTGSDVMALQQILNQSASTQVAASGAGSPGNESTYFGSLTQKALAKWQAAHNVSPASGYFGPITRAAIAASCGGTPPPTAPAATQSPAPVPAQTPAPAQAQKPAPSTVWSSGALNTAPTTTGSSNASGSAGSSIFINSALP